MPAVPIQIPTQTGSSVPSGSKKQTSSACAPESSYTPATSGTSYSYCHPTVVPANPVDTARQYMGKPIEKVRQGPMAQYMDNSKKSDGSYFADNADCCANFAVALWEKAGWLAPPKTTKERQAYDYAPYLVPLLQHAPNVTQVHPSPNGTTDWAKVKPGAVVVFQTTDAQGNVEQYGHVEVYTGKTQGGLPVCVGSNNVNSDGTQSVTEGAVSYPVTAVFQPTPPPAPATPAVTVAPQMRRMMSV
jgi:hypothetical protein